MPENSDTLPSSEERASPFDAKPRKTRSFPRLLFIATLTYSLALLVICAGFLLGPENWWLTGLNLYLPQWFWGLPLALLFPWYLMQARRQLWIPLLLLLLVIGPIMGLSFHPFHSSPSANGLKLRVMTYNIKGARRDVKAIVSDIQQYKPDLILTQDTNSALNSEFGQTLKGWNILAVDQYIIASRLPISDMDVRWISYPEQNHRVERCLLHVRGRDIVVYSCHLMSPRWGLAAMKHPRAGMASLTENMDVRVKQSARLASHVHTETLPVLLTGDLNAPVQSIVCKNLAGSGLSDAFSAAGAGYGYTYGETTKAGYSYVRIDHIMVSPQWQVLSCWVGNELGSDHCPVFADLFLPDDAK